MEYAENGEHGLINELIQGKELAKQLCNLLSSSSSSSSKEILIDKILSTYEKALTMLNSDSTIPNLINSHSSSSSINGSPSRSDLIDNDEEFKDKPPLKKRKTMPKWTEKVKVCSKTGLEGSLDDGYSWRKYGQKDILGAKFPRGYYRCTYRNVQGCLATKQVQRSDEDPTMIEVNYRGRHTCTQSKHSNKAFPSKTMLPVLEKNQFHKFQNNQPQKQEKMEQTQEEIFNFEAKLELDTNTNITTKDDDIFPWFCYLSPSMGSENGDNDMLLSDSMFLESFSPDIASFISPSTSESDLFCLSPCQFGSSNNNGIVQASESDITEILSAPTSVTNSPIMDFDMLLDKLDFDTIFPSNTTEISSS
ncbi:probable WRKY transcription factor 30 [Arachis duranensis]|uniref:Probable WRKY transcription factor 30 n=1 Tax=Arachis duranensis TaxID=130453 RepID=A0A6P4DHF1_ARADU|nr:probable WRKY transcription factor 30 [Arachis duranensis]